jgi:hypothetical protein
MLFRLQDSKLRLQYPNVFQFEWVKSNTCSLSHQEGDTVPLEISPMGFTRQVKKKAFSFVPVLVHADFEA